MSIMVVIWHRPCHHLAQALGYSLHIRVKTQCARWYFLELTPEFLIQLR